MKGKTHIPRGDWMPMHGPGFTGKDQPGAGSGYAEGTSERAFHKPPANKPGSLNPQAGHYPPDTGKK